MDRSGVSRFGLLPESHATQALFGLALFARSGNGTLTYVARDAADFAALWQIRLNPQQQRNALLHGVPPHPRRPAALRGRPPFAPLRRAAAAFAGEVVAPACAARWRSI